MSVQAEQLVYDFLSRVGDAAHGVLTPTARLRFVSELRSRIDAERAGGTSASVADVRSLLDRFGDPELLVRAEASRGGTTVPSQGPIAEPPPLAEPAIPGPSLAGPRPLAPPLAGPATGGGSLSASGPRATAVEEIFDVPAVPLDDEQVHRGGMEDTLPGAGGASIPPITDQGGWPPPPPGLVQDPSEPTAWPEPTSEVIVPTVAPRRGWSLPAAFGRLDAGFLASHKREALASLVLFAGGVFSSIVLVVIGYAIALTSYTWTAKDKRFGLIGLPALTVLVFVIGIWLEATGRWGGAPLAGSRLSGLLRDLVAVFPRVIGLLAPLVGLRASSWRAASG